MSNRQGEICARKHRKKIIDTTINNYFNNELSIHEFVRVNNLKYSIQAVHSWIKKDQRYQKQINRRHHYYSNQFKYNVLNANADGASYRKLCEGFGISNWGIIQHWKKQLFGKREVIFL